MGGLPGELGSSWEARGDLGVMGLLLCSTCSIHLGFGAGLWLALHASNILAAMAVQAQSPVLAALEQCRERTEDRACGQARLGQPGSYAKHVVQTGSG